MSAKTITVRLDDDLHAQVRELCFRRKTTMQTVVVDLLEKWARDAGPGPSGRIVSAEELDTKPAPAAPPVQTRSVVDWAAIERDASAALGEPSQPVTDRHSPRLKYLMDKLGVERFFEIRKVHMRSEPVSSPS